MSNFDDRIEEIKKQFVNINSNINNVKTVKYFYLIFKEK
jgi:hypothetical protein